MFRRLGVLAAAAVASLALASTASAAPTTPIMAPIPYFACGNVTASWTPSTPDPGGIILGYRVDLGDLTAGTSSAKATGALSMPLSPLVANHEYVARVRAIQYRAGQISYSAPSGRVFQKTCLFIDPAKIARDYVLYNPWPECIMCDVLQDLNIKDRVILTAKPPIAERFGGLELEVDGAINFR
jgi:hypothetical protein